MDAYQLALDQGRKELAAAQAQHRQLTHQIAQLEAIVTQLQAFISKGGPNAQAPLFDTPASPATSTPAPTAHATASAASPPPPPLWKAIVNALNGKKSDFTVPEALQALERTGRYLGSQNRLNIIRNTLIQRENIFGRLSPGHYFVRGYEKKAADDDGITPLGMEEKGW